GVAPPVSHWLDRIYEGSQRLNRLVEQMLKLLLADHFDRPLVRQEVPLADLLRSAAAEAAMFVEGRHQKLELGAPPDLGHGAVDADKLRDSVAHLLINAIKFTPDGGTIHLSARRAEDGGVAIDVRDTGVGIEPACLERIFHPLFTHVDVSRHSSGVFEFGRRG